MDKIQTLQQKLKSGKISKKDFFKKGMQIVAKRKKPSRKGELFENPNRPEPKVKKPKLSKAVKERVQYFHD